MYFSVILLAIVFYLFFVKIELSGLLIGGSSVWYILTLAYPYLFQKTDSPYYKNSLFLLCVLFITLFCAYWVMKPI